MNFEKRSCCFVFSGNYLWQAPKPKKAKLAHEKFVHFALRDTYWADICTGFKTWEFRNASEYWEKRIRNATHVVFGRGDSPAYWFILWHPPFFQNVQW